MLKYLKSFPLFTLFILSFEANSGLSFSNPIVNEISPKLSTFFPKGPSCLDSNRDWILLEAEESTKEASELVKNCFLIIKKNEEGKLELIKNPNLNELPKDLKVILELNQQQRSSLLTEIYSLKEISFKPSGLFHLSALGEKVSLTPSELKDGGGLGLARKIILKTAKKIKEGRMVSSDARYLLDMYMKGKFDPFPEGHKNDDAKSLKKKVGEVFGFKPRGYDNRFSRENKKYMTQSFGKYLEFSAKKNKNPSGAQAVVTQYNCPRFSSVVSPSIIPYKGGDLDRICEDRIKQIKRLGSKKVTLFFPVHMQTSGCKQLNPEGKTIAERKFSLGSFGGPFPGELERCLKIIDNAGLSLKFVPHLEYIQTMIDSGESFWRNNSCVPTDDVHYYEAAYSELFRIISKQGFKGEVDLSLAAEIDNSILARPQKTLKLIQKLKRKKRDLGINGKLSWSPNGDFYASSSGSKVCENPSVLKQILTEIDSLEPSIYEEHGHVAYSFNGKPSYKGTKEKFLSTLFDGTDYFKSCENKIQQEEIDKIKKDFKKIFRDNFSIGEFGLGASGRWKDQGKSSQEFYGDFIEQAYKDNPESEITLWNSGNWDPFDFEQGNGVEGDFSGVERGNGFFSYLKDCSDKKTDKLERIKAKGKHR